MGERNTLPAKYFVSLLLVLIRLGTAASANQHRRVIGGRDDIAGEYSYIVRLESIETRVPQHEFHVLCTGTLVSSRWVVTAGHCVKNKNTQIVRYGDVTVPRKLSTISKILKKVLHPKILLTTQQLRNDIGLLLIGKNGIETKGKFSSTNFKSLVGKMAHLVGFGSTSAGKISVAKALKMEVTPLKIGEGMIFNTVSDIVVPTIIVAPECKNKMYGVQNGDSGGPLFVNGLLVGVGSVVVPDYPRIQYFTPVSPYLDWIRDVMVNTKIEDYEESEEIDDWK